MPAATQFSRKRAWLAWENQRRNRSVSQAIGACLLEVPQTVSRGLARYLWSITRTISFVRREKPAVIFASNPSMMLALVAVALGRVLRVPVLLDAHTAGIHPFNGKKWWANQITCWLTRLATVTIVHNMDIEPVVQSRGGKTFVLPDPVPDLPQPAALETPPPLRGRKNVFYICSYDYDEPFREVANAGALLPSDVCIYVSGRRKERMLAAHPPDNVIATGFLEEQEYVRMLYAADVVMVLTNLDNCVLCGAYEAVAAERPVVLTDSAALRRVFSRGAVYTENRAESIARAIEHALAIQENLASDVRELKKQLIASWEDRRIEFEKLLGEIADEANRDRRITA